MENEVPELDVKTLKYVMKIAEEKMKIYENCKKDFGKKQKGYTYYDGKSDGACGVLSEIYSLCLMFKEA